MSEISGVDPQPPTSREQLIDAAVKRGFWATFWLMWRLWFDDQADPDSEDAGASR